MTSRSRGTNLIVSKAQRNPFYPRMALIGTNKTEALAESLILCRKIEFSAKNSFVFIRTTICHLLVFLERFLCSHSHKYLIMNTKNTHNYIREYSSFYPSIKSSGGGSRGGTLNCQGFPCKQIIVSLHSPPAARRA